MILLIHEPKIRYGDREAVEREFNIPIFDDDWEVEGEHLVYMANKKRMCRECVTSTCSFLQQPVVRYEEVKGDTRLYTGWIRCPVWMANRPNEKK